MLSYLMDSCQSDAGIITKRKLHFLPIDCIRFFADDLFNFYVTRFSVI